MSVRVVTKIEPGLQPLHYHSSTRIPLSVHVELPLIDKDCHRDLLGLKRLNQPCRNPLEVCEVFHLADDWSVINSDRYPASLRRLRHRRQQ
jgi:hypothetical protein